MLLLFLIRSLVKFAYTFKSFRLFTELHLTLSCRPRQNVSITFFGILGSSLILGNKVPVFPKIKKVL